jgi:hypothetical protein
LAREDLPDHLKVLVQRSVVVVQQMVEMKKQMKMNLGLVLTWQIVL